MVEDGRDLKKTPSLISTFYILLPSSTTHRIHVRYIDLHSVDVGKLVGKLFHSHWSITALGVMSSTRQLAACLNFINGLLLVPMQVGIGSIQLITPYTNEGTGPISGIYKWHFSCHFFEIIWFIYHLFSPFDGEAIKQSLISLSFQTLGYQPSWILQTSRGGRFGTCRRSRPKKSQEIRGR